MFLEDPGMQRLGGILAFANQAGLDRCLTPEDPKDALPV